jgi:hypothetical protein
LNIAKVESLDELNRAMEEPFIVVRQLRRVQAAQVIVCF